MSWVLCAGVVLVASVAWGQSSSPTKPEPWTTPGTEASSPTPSAAPAVTACDPSDGCRRFGLCTAHERRCYAASDEECRRSEGCREGRCTAEQGRCVVGAPADCRQSVGCRDHGRCSLRANQCVVASDADCGQTAACRVYRACVAREGRCVFGSAPAAALASLPPGETKPRSLLVYRVGIGFTVAGSALAVMGGALMANDEARLWSAAIVAPTAGVLLASGIPLWALGGSAIPAASEPQSEAATIGGVVLTTFGLGGTAVSGIFAAAGTKMALVPLGLSLGAIGGGVALATYGAEEVPLGTARTLPNVRLGPGSLDLTWSF